MILSILRRWSMLWMSAVVVSLSYAADTAITAVAYTKAGTHAYVGLLSATQIQYCEVSPQGRLDHCVFTGPTSFIMPNSLTLHPEGNFLYVVDHVYHSLAKCSIQAITGQLVDCADMGFVGDDPVVMAVDPQGRYAYMTHATGAYGLSICAITATGGVERCRRSTVVLNRPAAVALNTSGTKAYLLSAQAKVIWTCNIDQMTGALTHCLVAHKDTRRSAPILAHNIYANLMTLNKENYVMACTMDVSGSMSLINQYPDGSDFRCIIDQNTADFKDCFTGGSQQGYAEPLTLLLNAKNTRLDILSAGQVKESCVMNTHGTLVSCGRVL